MSYIRGALDPKDFFVKLGLTSDITNLNVNHF